MSSINSISRNIEKEKSNISKYQKKICSRWITDDAKAEYRQKIKDHQDRIIDLEADLEKKKRKEANREEKENKRKQRLSLEDSHSNAYDDNSLLVKIIFTIFPLLLCWWMLKIPFYIISFPIRVLFSRNKRLIPFYSFKRF